MKRLQGTIKSKEQKKDGKVLRVHKGDCVWPLEGSSEVLLGDDNTLCVTCDPQRYCNQLEKHCRCESSTSTLPLEKSTVQRIVQNVDTACGPRGLTDLLGWKTQGWAFLRLKEMGAPRRYSSLRRSTTTIEA